MQTGLHLTINKELAKSSETPSWKINHLCTRDFSQLLHTPPIMRYSLILAAAAAVTIVPAFPTVEIFVFLLFAFHSLANRCSHG